MTFRILQTAPLVHQVLTLNEAKEHLRVTSSHEDHLIDALVQAATDYLHGPRGILGSAFLPSEYRAILSTSPSCDFALPIGPVASITQIRYRSTAGVDTLYPAANYRLSGDTVELVTGAAWPEVETREQAFWVDFVCGYGTPGAVPNTIKQIARLLIGLWFENRSAVVLGTIATPLPLAARALILSARQARTLI